MGTGRVLMKHSGGYKMGTGRVSLLMGLWGGYKMGTGRVLMKHSGGYKMGTCRVSLLMRLWGGYKMGTAITRTPSERYSRRFRSLVLSSCDVFRALSVVLFVEITNYRSKLNKPTQSSARF